MNNKSVLEKLNPQQREAVVNTEGPMLVIAGAGSGKTRVLTHRIAYLIGVKGVRPENILAVTFTNKAANEMKARVAQLLQGVADVKGIWMGTFHSMCVRMMRPHADRLGYRSNFTIYDKEDQKALLKEILKAYDFTTPKTASSVISKIKNKQEYDPPDDRFQYIYEEYQKALKEANAMDFDDLILNAIKLLRENPDVCQKYASRFEYIHVDEYQDTNRPQYHLLVLLSSVHRNIFVVGDEDQSIYSFRGADINNILNFEKDFPDAKIMKLEENYRSTATILGAANAVITNNTQRRGKTLWTENEVGDAVLVMQCEDEREEAEKVAKSIADFMEKGFKPKDIAVLYRTNAQSRSFEEALRAHAVPYEMRGSLKFYERKEIKDIVAYMRVLVNPWDEAALRRAVNVPPRRIGKRTMDKVVDAAAVLSGKSRVSPRQVLAMPDALHELGISGKLLQSISDFNQLLSGLEDMLPDANALEITQSILHRIDYKTYLFSALEPKEAESRWENITELLGTVEEHVRKSEDPSLRSYLSTVLVQTELDDETGSLNAITLMTVHAAKGTEFPVVFVTGLENGVFPHHSSTIEGTIEEERRLFYVAMTRAQKHLVLSYARRRYIRKGLNLQPSPFLAELPEKYTEWEKPEAKMAVNMGVPVDFAPGQRVVHAKFGKGSVLEAYDGKVVVAFDYGGVKTLMKDFLKAESL